MVELFVSSMVRWYKEEPVAAAAIEKLRGKPVVEIDG